MIKVIFMRIQHVLPAVTMSFALGMLGTLNTLMAEPHATSDWRNIGNAVAEIPSEGYCDQPYLVINRQGHWVCVMTTGAGKEGSARQHVVATISQDQGRSWSPLIDIEPADGPEASWAVPYVVPSGRIYAIYTYNARNMRSVKDYQGVSVSRVDTLGKLMLKYSDDGGRTWSSNRFPVPMRTFEIDRNNVYGGEVQFFWSISKPIRVGEDLFMGMSKIGNFGQGFIHSSEGCVLRSPNLLTETDPDRICWETLPVGDIGLRAPAGEVAEEHNIVALSDGSLFCVFRTVAGFACQAYSRDGGRSWHVDWLKYAPGGRRIKQPRCLAKVYRFENGKYLLFFHNNGTTNYNNTVKGNRNPTWITGGVEKDGAIHWTQPEVFLYDDNYFNGISYPDWLEQDGRYYFSETQKSIARIHEIPAEFLKMLWSQFERQVVVRNGLALELKGDACKPGTLIEMPLFGAVWKGAGLALEFDIETGPLEQDQILFSNRVKQTPTPAHGASRHLGQGLEIKLLSDGQLQVTLDDLISRCVHVSGNHAIRPHSRHHIVVNIDGGSRVLSLVVDGQLLDGGERPYGFTRFSPYLSDVNGAAEVRIGKEFPGRVRLLRIYKRYLRTTEAIGNCRATRDR